MKVLIMSPSIFYFGGPSHGLSNHIFYLWSYLVQRNPGLEVEVLDLERELSLPNTPLEVDLFLQAAAYMLGRTDFDVVGISCWTSMSYLSTMAIARLCKRLNPACTVVVGGYHPSVAPADFRAPGTPVDFIVAGEGEEAFHRIVNGEVPRETPAQMVAGVPLPLDAIDLRWGEYKYHRIDTGFGLWLSRGCPFSCAFCLDRQTRWRGYTPRQAVAEVDRLLRACPRAQRVEFMDPLWGISKEWRREFLPLLVERGYDVKFGAETRVDLLAEEDFQLIGRLDFQVDLGVESVVPEILTIMKKTKDPARYLEAFWQTDAWMTANRITHCVYQILNYPGETTRTLDESLRFWERYFDERAGGYGLPSPQSYKWFPGGEVAVNWPEYEQRYGARVLYPEWWKMEVENHFQLMGSIVPSRELAEANRLGYWQQVADRLVDRGFAALAPEAQQRLRARLAPPVPVLEVRDSPGYFDRKPLQLAPKAVLHQKLSTGISLYSFDSGQLMSCSAQTSAIVKALVQDGATVAGLVAEHARAYPNPGQYEQKLRGLVTSLVENRMLALALPAPGQGPPPQAPQAVLRTDLGDIVIALHPDRAPAAVRAFLHLAALGYYDGLQVTAVVPAGFAQVGPHATRQGVGFSFELDATTELPERGMVVFPRFGPTTSGGQFCLVREAGPAFPRAERATVFGHVVSGLELADQLLRGDAIRAVTPAPAPVGVSLAERRETSPIRRPGPG